MGRRFPGLAAALLTVLLAPPAARAQEEEARLRVDPDAPLPPQLRELLGTADPARGSWPSEQREREVNHVLKRFGQALRARLAGAEPPSSSALAEIAMPDYAGTALAPAPDASWSSGPSGFRIRRVPAAAVGDSGEQGPSFEQALTALAARWSRLERLKFKVETVHARGTEAHPTLETQLLVHLAGELAAGGRSELSGRWRATWSLAADREPRLARIESLGLEELASDGPGLVDRTGWVTRGLAEFGSADGEARPIALGGDLPRPFGWGVGISELRRRLDTRLGIPLLGAPAGIAVGDVNGDGWEDLYLCQPGGLPNRLLLHGEDHALVDVSAASGTDWLDFSRSALLLDLDGDGDLDLAVTLGLELLLAENDGGGRFTPRAVLDAPQATSLAAADYDLDGDLDLYVCAYFSPYETRRGGTGLPTPYHDATNGEPNRLFENGGDWRFDEVSQARGMTESRFTFAAAWEDYDDDGDPDLYVANDFGRNHLYRNDGGHFVDVAAQAGVEDMAAGMGAAWGDYDGDGRFDLCVSNMYSAAGRRVTSQPHFQRGASEGALRGFQRHARGNSLFRNLGDEAFADESVAAGITVGRWAWGARFVDLDGDGTLDVLSPNGFLTGPRDDDL